MVVQDLTRIDDAVAAGELARNEVLRELFGSVAAGGRLHLIGLVSDGGVHSGWRHLEALIALGAQLGVPDLVLHAFTDGRDTLPHSGAGFLETVEGWCAAARECPSRQRHRPLLRDGPRLALGAHAAAPTTCSSTAAPSTGRPRAPRRSAPPTSAARPTSSSRRRWSGDEARIRPADDAVLGFNFRPDRMRQITRALAEPECDEIDRGGAPPVARYATMAEYEEGWPYPVAFPPARPAVTLASVLAERGMPQLHVAETEKYAHVTYFFNGGEETPYEGEERELIPSPRDVPTYDHKPEMSAARGRGRVRAARGASTARASGSSTSPTPTWSGTPASSRPPSRRSRPPTRPRPRSSRAVHESGGACLITADHGNCDHMLEPDGSPNTAHSLNPVPVIVTAPDLAPARRRRPRRRRAYDPRSCWGWSSRRR